MIVPIPMKQTLVFDNLKICCALTLQLVRLITIYQINQKYFYSLFYRIYNFYQTCLFLDFNVLLFMSNIGMNPI